ncbi:MAG: hypothetical protein J6V09_01020 [Clostridia bacterium]|nr:hypothetical protein [Clostridia bacterium]
MKKHLYTTARYFIFFFLCFIIFYPIRASFDALYNALTEWFPGAFPEYNFITNRAAAAAHEARANFITAILTLVLTNIISVIYDNSRFEYMIAQTDGFYHLKVGFKLYTGAYLLSDALASLLVPIPLLCLLFVPDFTPKGPLLSLIKSALSAISAPCRAFSSFLGIPLGACLIIAISFISRLAAAYLGLKRWRATWLSDIGR